MVESINTVQSGVNNIISVVSQDQSDQNDIYVQCIQQKSKIRMRIINSKYYSTNLNCQGPKSIRIPGAIYKLQNPKVSVQSIKNTTFYKLPNNISLYKQVQLTSEQASQKTNWLTRQQLKELNIPIYEEQDCVICMDNKATVILLPCSHKQFCKKCILQQEGTSPYYSFQKKQNSCVICRSVYTHYYEIIESE